VPDLDHPGKIGTTLFMAQEVMSNDLDGCPIDVYAFGVTLYSLFTALKVMDDGRKHEQPSYYLVKRILKGTRFPRVPEIPDAHWAVIIDAGMATRIHV
jgi:hypothetical protein